jgi:hypothetical protein
MRCAKRLVMTLYTDTKLADDQQEEMIEILQQNLDPEEGATIMRSIAQKYYDEGEEKGISIGMENAALNMLKEKVNVQTISKVTGISIVPLLKLQTELSQKRN